MTPHSTVVSQPVDRPVLTATDALLTAAAVVEADVNDLVQRYEQRERDLRQRLEQRERELGHERLRLNAAYRWLLLVRRTLHRGSHRATSRVVRDAVRELTTTQTPQSPLAYWNRWLRIAS